MDALACLPESELILLGCLCCASLQVDQKLNEELMGQEVDALVKCVDQHKAMLQEQMLDEVCGCGCDFGCGCGCWWVSGWWVG